MQVLPLLFAQLVNIKAHGPKNIPVRFKRYIPGMAEGGLDFIVIDYLQLMQGSRSRKANDNRQQEVTEISRGLKALARELQVPVLALSQLSRSVELRQSKQPMLSDLRESGSLEQDADIVMFLYREDYYKGADDTPSHITELIVAKHRNGPTGRVTLFFKEDCTPTMRNKLVRGI